jgi:hypothetical protein
MSGSVSHAVSHGQQTCGSATRKSTSEEKAMFDSMRQFPTTRAQHYPHWPTSDQPPIDHLAVDVSVVEVGMVTLAASTKDAGDSYGTEST